MSRNSVSNKVYRMAQIALLIALVFVLQTLGSFIKIGALPLSFVLVPIVIGAIHLGPVCGAVLGGVFGLITVIMGITGVDAFSFMLWEINPVCFILVCMLKAVLAGLVPSLVYRGLLKLFRGKGVTAATVISSVCAPIVNTCVFVVGMLLFFTGAAESLMTVEGFTGFENAVQVVILGLAGLNFVGEFTVNLVLSPAIVRIIDAVSKKRG